MDVDESFDHNSNKDIKLDIPDMIKNSSDNKQYRREDQSGINIQDFELNSETYDKDHKHLDEIKNRYSRASSRENSVVGNKSCNRSIERKESIDNDKSANFFNINPTNFIQTLNTNISKSLLGPPHQKNCFKV